MIDRKQIDKIMHETRKGLTADSILDSCEKEVLSCALRGWNYCYVSFIFVENEDFKYNSEFNEVVNRLNEAGFIAMRNDVDVEHGIYEIGIFWGEYNNGKDRTE